MTAKKEPLFWINPKTRIRCDNLNISWKELPYDMLCEAVNLNGDTPWVYSNKKGIVMVIPCPDYSSADFLYCSSVDFTNMRLQYWLKRTVRALVAERAGIILPQRLHALEKKHNLKARSVTVKKLRKDRLGQCDFLNNIDLSPEILLYPAELTDSIILHEMAHIKHKHHRKSFWAFLSILLGEDAKVQNDILDEVISRKNAYLSFLFR